MLEAPVLFSVELTVATFVKLPVLIKVTLKLILMLDPFVKLPIFQTIVLPETTHVKLALLPSNLNASSNTSVILTLVALEGPKLVTVIVNVTLSETFTIFLDTSFVMLNSTAGSTITGISLGTFVLFSLQLTTATFL